MNVKGKYSVLFVVACVLCLSTILGKSSLVETKEKTKTVLFGYPIEFVSQDFSREYAKNFVPVYIDFSASSEKLSTTRVHWSKLTISVFAWFLALSCVIWLLESLKSFLFRSHE